MNSKVKETLALLFGIALALSISAALIIGAVFMLDGLVALAKGQRADFRDGRSIGLPLVLLFFWGIVASVTRGSISAIEAASVQSSFVIFFFVVYDFDDASLRRMVVGFCAASVGAALLGLFQAASGNNFNPQSGVYLPSKMFVGWPDGLLRYLSVRNERAIGTRNHPLTYSEGLIPAFLLLLFLVFRSLKADRRLSGRVIRYGVGTIVLAGGLVVGQSRAIWVAALVGALFLLPSCPRRLRWAALASVAILPMCVLIASPSLRQRTLSIFSGQMGRISDQQSRATRFELWKMSRDVIREHPFMGDGIQGLAFKLYDPALQQERVWSESHDVLLQTAAEEGLVALALLLLIFFSLIYFAIRWRSPWKYLYLSCLVAFFIAGVSESWTRDKEIAMIFWALVGSFEFLRLREKFENI